MPFWRRPTSHSGGEAGSQPPGDRAVATYARVLDGAHLWFEVTSPTSGTLAFVGPDGAVTALDGTAIGAGVATPLVVDLARLPGDGDAEVELRLVGADGGSRPVRLDDTGDSRRRSRVSPDRRFRWTVDADKRGGLRLSRSTLAPAVPVSGLALVEDDLEVRWRAPAATRPRLVLRDAAGAVVAEVDAVPQGDDEVCATLRDRDLPPGALSATLGAGDGPGTGDGSVKPLCRDRDDLARPSEAVLLPETRTLADGGETVLRLAWTDEGELAVERTSESVSTA